MVDSKGRKKEKGRNYILAEMDEEARGKKGWRKTDRKPRGKTWGVSVVFLFP